MKHAIKPISDGDRESVIDLFNYYVESSFAAFPEKKVPYSSFEMFLQMAKGLPTGTIKDQSGELLGFGLLRCYNPLPTFLHTAEITYFIDCSHTGKGLGRSLLAFLEKEGRKKGIKTILAQISSLNPRSIEFHKQNGFRQRQLCFSYGNGRPFYFHGPAITVPWFRDRCLPGS